MKFSDIDGHDDIKNQLRSLVADNCIPHALLFEGPSGIGKLSMARAFAQYVHCQNPTADGDSCGICPSCVQHQSFNHLDTHYTYPVIKNDSNHKPLSADFATEWHEFLSIDPYASFARWVTFFDKKNAKPVIYVTESNELIRMLSFTTHGSRYKIVIIWLAEKMNEETANKMLKILEEPFEDTIFLLTADEPMKILPTVYSRLRRIQMKRLPDETVARYLVSTQGVNPTDASAIAHLADGSVSAALEQISVVDASSESLDMFASLMRHAYQRRVKELREWANKLDAMGRDKEIRFYEYAQRLIRENFIYNFGNNNIVYMNRAESNFSVRFARFIHERNAEDICHVMDDAIRDITGNANGKIVNFDVAIRLIFLLKR
ncbi:MAG: DNA polymerase III subunit delta [Muribaculaceae bacterium]|nr:DNA polymerase III subunit delta [Muribaculaceae bacterium]